MKTNPSSKFPYVLMGSAVGGAAAFLLLTESGRNLRRSIPDLECSPERIERARFYIERQGRDATEQIREVLDRAKDALENGQRTYHEAGEEFNSQLRDIEERSDEMTTAFHRTIDGLSNTAIALERSILTPLYEILAIAKGVDSGVRNFFGDSSPHQLSGADTWSDSGAMKTHG